MFYMYPVLLRSHNSYISKLVSYRYEVYFSPFCIIILRSEEKRGSTKFSRHCRLKPCETPTLKVFSELVILWEGMAELAEAGVVVILSYSAYLTLTE